MPRLEIIAGHLSSCSCHAQLAMLDVVSEPTYVGCARRSNLDRHQKSCTLGMLAGDIYSRCGVPHASADVLQGAFCIRMSNILSTQCSGTGQHAAGNGHGRLHWRAAHGAQRLTVLCPKLLCALSTAAQVPAWHTYHPSLSISADHALLCFKLSLQQQPTHPVLMPNTCSNTGSAATAPYL